MISMGPGFGSGHYASDMCFVAAQSMNRIIYEPHSLQSQALLSQNFTLRFPLLLQIPSPGSYFGVAQKWQAAIKKRLERSNSAGPFVLKRWTVQSAA